MNDFEWEPVLAALAEGLDLSSETSRGAAHAMMTGQASDEQIGAFLLGLRAKGETAVEVAGMASVMRELSLHVDTELPVVDTCGTGGDGSNSANISTLAALVVAGAGVPVAKHGNRAASGTCGSADVLEALGVTIDLAPEGVAACLEEAGFGFCFAPVFHPAMRFVGPVRRSLGVPTIYNFLGPLTNPAGARRQVVGVADVRALGLMSEALAVLGTDRAWFVHGADGMDELTTSGPASVVEVVIDGARAFTLDPAELGFPAAGAESLRGGDISTNAAIARAVLDGESGPISDAVLLNAAAVLVVAGMSEDLTRGVEVARDSLAGGRARGVLEKLVAVSTRLVS